MRVAPKVRGLVEVVGAALDDSIRGNAKPIGERNRDEDFALKSSCECQLG